MLKQLRGSWIQTRRLSLPYPLTIPILNICTLIIMLALILLSKKYFSTRRSGLPSLLAILFSFGATSVPVVFTAVSAVYTFPSDLRDCSGEKQWARMFQLKNEAAIRSIQDQLRCCGFNSMHDRAWPFPSKDYDARACERTQGYHVPCVRIWVRKLSTAAFLGGLASFLIAVVLVSNCTKR